MAYPEHGAGYRSNGKSVLRMAGERAEGGSVDDRKPAPRAAGRDRDSKPAPVEDDGVLGRLRRTYGAPNPDVAKGVGQTLGFKRGGRVKRADGGALPEPEVDDRGRTLAQLAGDEPDEAPLKLKPPSSSEAAQDAREHAAKRTRRTRAMPNSFRVGGE